MKNLFQPFFSHLTSFPYLYIRGRCTHTPYTQTFKGPPTETQLFITLRCHQDATHISKAHCTSLSRTVYLLSPLTWQKTMSTMDNGGPRLYPAHRNIIGFHTAKHHRVCVTELGKAQNTPRNKTRFNLRNTYLDVHLKNVQTYTAIAFGAKLLQTTRTKEARQNW